MNPAGGNSAVVRWENGGEPVTIRYHASGEGDPVLYLHGWGTGRQLFLPLIDSLGGIGRHIAIDFPGFGESTKPSEVWGTEEYAECVVRFLDAMSIGKAWIVSHSFGGRVSIRLAASHPDRVAGMAMIASAGLRRKQPWPRRIRVKTIQTLAKLARRRLPASIGQSVQTALYNRIASRDYLQAGGMRKIFVRVVNEDLSPLLPSVQAPALLVYGTGDTETPPWIGRRFHELLPSSRLVELPGFDHISILDRGRHQVAHHIRQWLDESRGPAQ